MRPCKNCGRDISHRVTPGPGRPPEYCEEPDTFAIAVPVTRRDVDTGRRVERAYRLGTTRCQWTRENKRKAAADHRRIKENPERFGVPMGLPKRGGARFVSDDGSGPQPLRAAGIAAIAGFSEIDIVPEAEPRVVERFTASRRWPRDRIAKSTASDRTLRRLERVHRPQAEYTLIDLPAHRDDPAAPWLAGRPEAVRGAEESRDRLLRVLNPSGETVTPHRSPVADEDEPEAEMEPLPHGALSPSALTPSMGSRLEASSLELGPVQAAPSRRPRIVAPVIAARRLTRKLRDRAEVIEGIAPDDELRAAA